MTGKPFSRSPCNQRGDAAANHATPYRRIQIHSSLGMPLLPHHPTASAAPVRNLPHLRHAIGHAVDAATGDRINVDLFVLPSWIQTLQQFTPTRPLALHWSANCWPHRRAHKGVLQPLSGAYVPGPRWSWLLHENCARDPLVMRFCEWLLATLPFEK